LYRRIVTLALCALVFLGALAAQAEDRIFDYRFAGAEEAAELLLSNRTYYEGLSQLDLDYRVQKRGATLAELEAIVREETLDYTEAEAAAVDAAMAGIERICAERGYALPPTGDIVFAKTTMREECDAGAYTHGTQIYLGQTLLSYGTSESPMAQAYFQEVVAHELFHCLTRNHPEFRRSMYAILGFTVVEEDYDFPPEIRARIISNPDVGHHNAYAAFDIGGVKRACAVVFITRRAFEQPGDSFFDDMAVGLVPIDDLSTMFDSGEAANFWDVFGRNTDYVIDPEETLADNFSFTIMYGPEGRDYASPGLIEAIDGFLRGQAGVDAAA